MVLHAIGNNRAGEAAGAAGRGVSNHGSRALRESMAEVTAFARRSEKGGAINQVRKRKFQADKTATLKAPRGRPALLVGDMAQGSRWISREAESRAGGSNCPVRVGNYPGRTVSRLPRPSVLPFTELFWLLGGVFTGRGGSNRHTEM